MPLSPRRGPAPNPEAPLSKILEFSSEKKPKKSKKVVDNAETDMGADFEGTQQTKISKEQKTSEVLPELRKPKKNKKLVDAMQSDMVVDDEGTEKTKLSKEERRAQKAAKKQLTDPGVEAETPKILSKEERKAQKAAKKQGLDTAVEAQIPESLSKEERRAQKAARKQEITEQDINDAHEQLSEAKKTKKAAKEKGPSTMVEEVQKATVDADAQTGRQKRKREEKEQEAEKRLKSEDGSAIAVVSVLGAKEYRSKHEITVNSEAQSDCPAPFENFEAVAPKIGQALTKALLAQGYAAPTPIQAQAWPVALQGRDMVAVAKTGSGKTCGFLLPALKGIQDRGPADTPKKISYYQTEPTCPSVLVVAPTRELCQQIAAEAAKFAPAVRSRVVAIYGGVGKVEQLRDLRKGADIVIATPGRLIDFCNGAKGREDLGPSIDLKNVKYLVLDEADRMLDMGFEPDIQKIASKCPGSKERQTLFFTATWPKAVKAAAASLTGSSTVQLRIGQNAGSDKLMANKDVKQTVMVIRRDEKLGALKKILKDQLAAGETAFVFGSTKMICDYIQEQIGGSNNYSSELGVWCRAIHSGKEQWDRDEALAKFRSLTAGKGSEKGVLIATDVAARGLDIPGVALVVIYDFCIGSHANPNTAIESYVHKIGRTGRAGKTGQAFTLFTSDDHGADKLCELLRGANQEVPKNLEDLAWQNRRQTGWSKGKGKGKGGGKGGGKGFGKGKGKGKSSGKRW